MFVTENWHPLCGSPAWSGGGFDGSRSSHPLAVTDSSGAEFIRALFRPWQPRQRGGYVSAAASTDEPDRPSGIH